MKPCSSSSTNPTISHLFTLLLSFIVLLRVVEPLVADNHRLVFNHCSNHTSFVSSRILLASLFQEFVAKSTKFNYFQTIVADDEIAVSGAFQCRNDLTQDDCQSCVSKFHGFSEGSCSQTITTFKSTRIQLSGCYAHYEVENINTYTDNTISHPTAFVHKACSENTRMTPGFEEMRYEALVGLENGVVSNMNIGFCETKYGSVHALAQCSGSIGACDCGDCVSNAVQIAIEKCPYSISGEVYLDSCFIMFDYVEDHHFGGYSLNGDGVGKNVPKLVAIVAGGLVAALLLIAFCYFASHNKKQPRVI